MDAIDASQAKYRQTAFGYSSPLLQSRYVTGNDYYLSTTTRKAVYCRRQARKGLFCLLVALPRGSPQSRKPYLLTPMVSEVSQANQIRTPSLEALLPLTIFLIKNHAISLKHDSPKASRPFSCSGDITADAQTPQAFPVIVSTLYFKLPYV